MIDNMAVDQRHRKQGIARLLLQACERHALAMGLECTCLAVHRENAPAHDLYLSSGYKEVAPAKPAGLSAILNFGQRSQHLAMIKDIRESVSM